MRNIIIFCFLVASFAFGQQKVRVLVVPSQGEEAKEQKKITPQDLDRLTNEVHSIAQKALITEGSDFTLLPSDYVEKRLGKKTFSDYCDEKSCIRRYIDTLKVNIGAMCDVIFDGKQLYLKFEIYGSKDTSEHGSMDGFSTYPVKNLEDMLAKVRQDVPAMFIKIAKEKCLATENKVWEDDVCKTMLQRDREKCEEKKKGDKGWVWVNNVCKHDDPQVDCANRPGMRWHSNACRTDEHADCLEKEREWDAVKKFCKPAAAPAVPVAPVAPTVPGGISGLQSAGGGYEFSGQKSYLVNITTEPEGAALSFNGMPDSRCIKTPCKIELADGKIRILASLEQYEIADTTVSVKQNNQNIDIKLKANFGVLEIMPAFLDGVGEYEGWKLAIDGKAVSSLKNNLSPGKYKVKLEHRCYGDVSFEAGINKGKTEVFNMQGKIHSIEGGLILSAEQDGEPVSEPVYVNGKRVGETPYSGQMSICSEVKVGDERVNVELKYKQAVKYTHKKDKPDIASDVTYDGSQRKKKQRKEKGPNDIRFGVRSNFIINDFSWGYDDLDESLELIGYGFGVGLALDIPIMSYFKLNVGLDIYYRPLFEGKIEYSASAGFEDMFEFVISVPVLLQFGKSYYFAVGAQLDFPIVTDVTQTWGSMMNQSYYLSDYFLENRSGMDFDLVLGLGYRFLFGLGIDFKYVYGLTSLFEDFTMEYDRATFEYKDKSSLGQYNFGVSYYF